MRKTQQRVPRPPTEDSPRLKLNGYVAWPEEPPGGKPRLRFSLSATVAGRPDRTAWNLIQRFGRPSQAGMGLSVIDVGTADAGADESTYNEFLERYVEATAAEAPTATYTLPFELFSRSGGQAGRPGLDPNCQGVFWVRPGARADFWLSRCRELYGRPVEVEVTTSGYRMPPEHPAAAARSGLLFDISWIKTLD